jgi:uncharacterized membrane protein YqhA
MSEISGPDRPRILTAKAEAGIERAILASRWILLVFYFGLAFALAL